MSKIFFKTQNVQNIYEHEHFDLATPPEDCIYF